MPGEEDIDITQDLNGTNGVDGTLGDAVPANGPDAVPQHGAEGQQRTPDGAVDANKVVQPDKAADFSIRDQLSNAFKGTEAGDPAADAAKPAAQQLTQDEAGKWRTPDGLFASKEQIEAFQTAQQQPTDQQQQQQQQAPSFLQGMTALEQQQYQSLPAEIREFFGRTMEDVRGRAERLAEYEQIEQHIIGPRRQAWLNNGMNPGVALNQLFNLSDFASTRPADFVMWFAEQNRLDLDKLLDERYAAQQNVDPQLREVQTQLQQLQGHINQQNMLAQQQQHNQNLEALNAFALEKDEGGSLKRPYLTEVMSTFPAHIQAIRTANPNMSIHEVAQKAYDAACWADPAVRTKMQQQATEAARAEAARKTQAARLAGASVQAGSSGGHAPKAGGTNSNGSLRDDLNAAFAEHAA
jgi:hypothetical protein